MAPGVYTSDMRLVCLLIGAMLATTACAATRVAGSDAPVRAGATQGASPAPFSFEDTASLLSNYEIYLDPMPPHEDTVLARAESGVHLRERMNTEPGARVVSVHEAIVDMPGPRFNKHDELAYVVEITGTDAGNCFDFYDAEDGRYWGSACDFPERG